MSLTGTPIPPSTPGSPEWLKTISASKIPAILGISPWQSKFALWHLMAGNTEPWAGNKTTERGTFLEAAVLDWFEAQHPELGVANGGSYAHPDRDDWTAAPDGLASDADGVYGIEVKTAQYSDGWGKPGTSEVPPYYLAQIAWQMIVCGFEKVYIPVLFGSPFEFREYIVEWDDIAADVPAIRAEVQAFEQSLADGVQPDIDGSSATYNTIKELHPEIDGETVEIPDFLARSFLEAKLVADHTAETLDLYKNMIADAMGTAKKATWNGQPLFSRQARGSGTPYLVAARTLPSLNTTAEAA